MCIRDNIQRMIYKNVSLKKYNTFGLDYMADCMIHLKTEEEATTFFKSDKSGRKPFLILGSGSNLLFTSDFKGTILYPEMKGMRIEERDRGCLLYTSPSPRDRTR